MIGNMRDSILQYASVLNELYADQSGSKKLKLTSGLVELAKQSYETKRALDDLMDDYRVAAKIVDNQPISGEEYNTATAIYEK